MSSEEDSYEEYLRWKRQRVRDGVRVAATPEDPQRSASPPTKVTSTTTRAPVTPAAAAAAPTVSPLAAFAARVEEDARRATAVTAPVATAPVERATVAAPVPVAASIVEPVVAAPAPVVVAAVPAAKDDTSEDSADPNNNNNSSSAIVNNNNNNNNDNSNVIINNNGSGIASSSSGNNKDKAELGAPLPPRSALQSLNYGGSTSNARRTMAPEHLWNGDITAESERVLLSSQFDGKAWTNAFRSARRENADARVAALRRLVQKGTNEALYNKYYEKDGHLVRMGDTTESVKRTTLYDGKSAFGSFSRLHQTTAHFVRADAVDVALFLMDKKNVNPVVLVLADEKVPGGSHEVGTCAQEESIYRRTTLRLSLEDPDGVAKDRDWKYEIAPFGGIYAPDVQVFRASEGRGYEYLPQPKRVSLVLASSLARPELVTHKKKTGKFLNEDDAKTTKKKIETILNIGLQNGHDAIVLTAFGCGYNHNPPGHMAKLFREVITQQFPACYRHVTFAIIDDENTKLDHNPEGNIRPFQEEFLNVTSRAASKKCVML